LIKYEQTRIRPLSINDIDNLMTWINDPEIVHRYAYFTKPISRKEELKWLKTKIESKTDFFYAIENSKGTYVGNVAIEKIHWPAKHGRLSITIGNKKERGKGHAFRAINLVLNKAFNELGLHRVYLIVTTENLKAQHIFKKCGFKIEGLLREHYIIDEQFVDMYIMGILKKIFIKIQR